MNLLFLNATSYLYLCRNFLIPAFLILLCTKLLCRFFNDIYVLHLFWCFFAPHAYLVLIIIRGKIWTLLMTAFQHSQPGETTKKQFLELKRA